MNYLVVDDEVAICQGTAQRLRRFLPQGESIVCAFNAEDALMHIRTSPVDILITDIRMGEMDGLHLIEQAREYHPELACIVITAYDIFKYAQQAIKLEVKDFLVKPYGESELREAVERVTAGLQKAQRQQQALLERHVYEALTKGEQLDRGLFARSRMKEPPESLRVVVWNEQENQTPEWTGEWCFCDREHQYLLTGDEREAVLQWMQTKPMDLLRFGISLAGSNLSELWKQAQQALRISTYENMPRWVFYQDAFEDELSFRQDHMALWAMNYIAENAGKPISMEEVCAKLHLNYTYFSRQFKQQIGVSFSGYLLKCQMQWALEKMKKGMRVNEVADALGYGSADSFCKAFVRVFGCAPRHYLNRQRKENQS